MEYYAHPNELLINHLKLAGYLAKEYGKGIGSEKITEFLGYFHDLGKRTEKFQRVLKRQQFHVDHAIVAAEVLAYLYRDGKIKADDDSILFIMMHILAAHHSEFRGEYDVLCQYIDDEIYILPKDLTAMHPTLDDNKENALSSDEEFKQILSLVSDNKFYGDISDRDHLPFSDMNEAAKMLYCRMLFSCLVDADYTSSQYADKHEGYSANDIEAIADTLLDEHILDADALLVKLNDYHNELASNGSEKEINKLRNRVYECASKAGRDGETGLYTMTAPTGLGKTLALIKFGLEQARKNGQKRIIVVLPYLSIIEQNADVYKRIFGDDMVIESDSLAENTEAQRELSERWDAPIIVTTSVNFFQTMFSARASGLRKLHRMANSVIVFDESQTLPFGVTSVSIRTLEALSEHFGSTVLLSTATQPSYNRRKDLSVTMTEVIDDVADLYDKYDKVKNTKTEFDTDSNFLSYKALADRYIDMDRVLYVVNTTQKAENLFNSVKEYKDGNAYLLSSRLVPLHKKAVLEKVREKLDNKEICHLVSTQCIEAGVDVSFPVGCREYAPLTSIIQTAGRIGRNGEGGHMYIFRLEDDKAPDDYYKNESSISMYMAKQNGADMNINSPKLIDDHYTRLYAGNEGCDEGYNNGKRDKEDSVSKAEVDEDVHAMYEAYHIIKDMEQFHIIVPYKPEIELFNELMNKYQNNGYVISKSDMKLAHGITVNIIGKGKAADYILRHCHRLSMTIKDGTTPLDWFIADMDDVYDDMSGLRVMDKNETDGLFL